MRSKHIQVLILPLIILIMMGCGASYEAVYPTLSDGKYDSEFPYRNCSEQLEDIGDPEQVDSSAKVHVVPSRNSPVASDRRLSSGGPGVGPYRRVCRRSP